MYHTWHEVTLQVNEYLLRWPYSEPDQKSKLKRFGKLMIGFGYLCKKTQS